MSFKTNPGRRYPDDFKDKAVQEYIESDLTSREIAKIYGVGNGTVWRWIAKFAKLNPDNTRLMEKIRANSKNYDDGESEANQSSEDIKAEECAVAPISNVATEAEIARLKEELRRAELKADLYAEMISVAEAKFNICIRKKAGAKQ